MAPPHTRRTVLRTGSAGVLALLAGCGAPTSPSESSTPAPSSADTPTGDVTATQSPGSTVGTGEDPVDITVVNRSGESQTLTIRVSEQAEGNTVLDRTLTLEPGDSREWDVLSGSDAGIYVVSVRLDDDTEFSYEWDLDEEPADGTVVITFVADGAVKFSYSTP